MRTIFSTVAVTFCLAQTAYAETFTANVWADNWFSFNVDGQQVAEDSVSITTEKSFNAESFSFTAQRPFVIGLTAKDFKENDSGLEYIGTRKQQMGDGGVIVQVKDASGNVVAVTNEDWRCLVTHTAPMNKSCAKSNNPVAGQGDCAFETTTAPDGWDKAGFDDSEWASAFVYSERDVSPKDGYDRINWDRNAELIWGPDLEISNTVLCRIIVE